jgi:rSAM/selenodomain-associated transferase 1
VTIRQRFFYFQRNVDSQRLSVFLKAPRPGEVKTRLARELGAEAACAAYCQMVECLFEQISSLESVELRFTPDDAAQEFRRWHRPGWRLAPQGEGDLGIRLRRTFADAFKEGLERVVVIGSDCPAVTVQDIEAGWAALDRHDLVIGPARDGGYWLIGLRISQPHLFEGIEWSSVKVLAQTIRKAESTGMTIERLRELNDIDTRRDWEAFLSGRVLS